MKTFSMTLPRLPWFFMAWFLFLNGGPAAAQGAFRQGYVVVQAGDTLRGEVEYRGAEASSASCRFRASASMPATNYSPEQLRGYGFLHDRIYQSHLIANAAPSPDTTKHRVFLEALVLGQVDLFYQRISSDEVFYVRSGTGPVLPLVARKEKQVAGGYSYVRRGVQFRGTLVNVMGSCPAVQNKIPAVEYKLSSLVALVRAYNAACGQGEVQQVSELAAQSRRFSLSLGAVAGVQTSTLRFTANSFIKEGTFRGKMAPALGLALQVNSPLLNNRLLFRLEGLFQEQYYETEFLSYAFNASGALVQARVLHRRIETPVVFRYTPFTGSIRPFIEGGMSAAYNLKAQCEYRFQVRPNSDYSVWYPYLETTLSTEVGLLGGIGITTARQNGHDLAFVLRAERTNGFSNRAEIETPITRFFALVSYNITH